MNSNSTSINTFNPFHKSKQPPHQSLLKPHKQIHIDKLKTQTQTTITIQSIPIYFPYQPYQCQLAYMKSVITSLFKKQNSLIQCPTGTGKTLSLLCSTLAYLHHSQSKSLHSCDLKIIYASRTHSQLKQVVKQLKKTPYCPEMVIASSRDMSCCNSELKSLDGALKETECRKRVSRVEGKGCMYFKEDQVIATIHSQIKNRVMDLEDLVSYGKSHKVCPFFYNKKVKETADLILMPYNYLFNRDVAFHYGIDCKNAIVIIDQGHNIPQVAEQGYSSSISLQILYSAIEEVSHLKQLILKQSVADQKQTSKRKKYQTTLAMVETYLEPLMAFHYYLKDNYYVLFQDKTDNIDQGCVIEVRRLFSHILKATQTCKKLPLTLNVNKTWNQFNSLSDSITGDLMFESMWAIERWKNFIQSVRKVITSSEDNEKRFVVGLEMHGNNLKIQIICLDASRMFEELKKFKPYNFIITSGTLSPINMWSLELGIDFPSPLSLPSPIKNDQIIVCPIQKGLNYTFFDLSYGNRNNDFMFKDLASSVFEIIKVIPNGIVIMFASYSLLENFRKCAGSSLISSYWKQKDLFFETKGATDFKADFQKYVEKSKTKKGAIFFAVMRGKLSQGLDLEADICRAMILIGVPYLSIKSKKIQSKKTLLDSQLGKQGTMTGNQWYMAETLRSINQAIGRVIRNQSDFGAIYLIDSRFYKQQITDNISSWARERMNKTQTINHVISQTKEFFAKKSQQALSNLSKQKYNKSQNKPSQQLKLPTNLNQELNSKFTPQMQQLRGITLTRPRHISISEKVKHTSDHQISKQKTQTTKSFLTDLKKKIDQQRENNPNENKNAQDEIIVTEPNQRRVQLELEREIFKGALIKPSLSLYSSKKKLPISEEIKKSEEVVEEKILCGICLMSQKLVANKACTHSFCHQCWKTWLQTNLCCPNCRIRVRQNYLILKLGDQLD